MMELFIFVEFLFNAFNKEDLSLKNISADIKLFELYIIASSIGPQSLK